MKINDVLRRKGSAVITIAPHESVASLVALLTDHNIGAVVVSADGHTVAGIVSERDVVRRLRTVGPQLLDQHVSSIMTTDVYTCRPDDDLAEMAGSMTEHRIRHLPVVVDHELIAIVSIGDIVKNRIDQLMEERDHLEGYITQ